MLQIDYSIYMMVPQDKISQQLKVTEQNDMSLDILDIICHNDYS